MEKYKEQIRNYLRRKKISQAKHAVAEFLLGSPEEAAFLNLLELSERIGVSPSTISRTSSEMGFDGYPGLQEEVRTVLKNGITPVERLRNSSLDTETPIWQSSLGKESASLQMLYTLNRPDNFQRAVELLAFSRRVYSFAVRSSYPLTYFFNLLLFQIRPEVHHMNLDDGCLTESVFDMEPGDVFFVVSLPRYTKLVLEITEKVRSIGCDVIAITDNETSPLALASKVAFFCPYESVSFFNSNVAAQAIINALLAEVSFRLGEEGVARLKKHSDTMKEWGSLHIDQSKSKC